MKHIYMIFVMVLFMPLQIAKAETLSLDTVIAYALKNSPETAQILSNMTDADSQAFEIETLNNPTVEADLTTVARNSSHSIGIEIEQPMRLSNFGSRALYADALRYTANIQQKAQILELVHTITRSYAAYWALQEQEHILSKNVKYVQKKQKLIKQAAKQGIVDIADANIFKAEALRLTERLRIVRAQKVNGAANLLRIAGMKQIEFNAQRPKSPVIPSFAFLSEASLDESSILSLLKIRQVLAEKRYNVAQQDADFPEFAPRAVIEHDFDENNSKILFGINVAIPIWDRNNAELARAKAERRLVQDNLNALNEYNFANILNAAYEQAKATQISASTYRNKIIPSWNKVKSITDKKFEIGQASVFDVFQMRERIMGVQNEAIQTYLNAMEAQITLESLVGQTLNGIKE